MKAKPLTIIEIGLIASTRVALGMGIGLLISPRFNRDQRKAAGWALVAVGAVVTIPLVINLASKPSLAIERPQAA